MDERDELIRQLRVVLIERTARKLGEQVSSMRGTWGDVSALLNTLSATRFTKTPNADGTWTYRWTMPEDQQFRLTGA